MNTINKKFKISLIGRLMYYTLKYRRSTIESNIDIVFGNSITKINKKLLTQAFYSHFIRSICEIFLLYFFYKKRSKKKIIIKGIEHLQNAANKRNGVFILTGHIGNVQYAPVLASDQLKKLGDFYIVLKYIKIKWLQHVVYSGFMRAGIAIIKSKGAIKYIQQILKENCFIFFAFDQHAKLDNRGLPVPFFGKLAGTYSSLAFLVHSYKASVVPGMVYRDQNNNHIMEFFPEVVCSDEGDITQQIMTNTKIFNETLEQLILQHPEQWMWSHRRWKLK